MFQALQPIVRIDGRTIVDAQSFHSVFAEAFGFPGFYGCNGDAWIDCLTCLDAPAEEAMTMVRVEPGQTLTLHIEHAEAMKLACPELLQFLQEASAFVNFRRIEKGEPAVLALSLYC